MKIGAFAVLAMAAVAAGGCASVVEGSTQPVTVSSTPENGATCTISNEQGKWTLTTPGTAIIKKSESPLAIHCSKAGYKDATVYAASRLSNTAMIGAMMPYVGLLDVAVNAGTGAATKYQDAFIVAMKPLVLPSTIASPAPPPAPAAPAAGSTSS